MGKSFDGPTGYREYMNSPEWRARRSRYFRKHARRCRACRFRSEHLNLHHKSYQHLGQEPDGDLVPLCPVCHDLVHQMHDLMEFWTLEDTTDRIIERIKTLGRSQVVQAVKDRRRNKAHPRPLYGLMELKLFQPNRKVPVPVATGPNVVMAGTPRARLPKNNKQGVCV